MVNQPIKNKPLDQNKQRSDARPSPAQGAVNSQPIRNAEMGTDARQKSDSNR